MSEQAIQPTRDVGRPTDMTPGTVDKLAAAFQRGFSVSTACKIARINRTTYYNWLKSSPEFVDRMEGAQEYAKILAGDTIVDVLQDVHRGKKDPTTGVVVPKKYSEQTVVNTSKWFLEKLERESFGSYLPENVDQCSGYYTWNDLIETFGTLDKNVWETQWECKRADTQGLVYSRFDDTLNIAARAIASCEVHTEYLGEIGIIPASLEAFCLDTSFEGVFVV